MTRNAAQTESLYVTLGKLYAAEQLVESVRRYAMLPPSTNACIISVESAIHNLTVTMEAELVGRPTGVRLCRNAIDPDATKLLEEDL